jgi:hypothetical protein
MTLDCAPVQNKYCKCDYQGQINAHNFEKWMKQVIPNLLLAHALVMNKHHTMDKP